MRPAVEHSFKRVVVRELEGALAMVAPEAGLVVDPVVGGELVDQVHRLVARHALGRRPLKGSRHCPAPSPSSSSLRLPLAAIPPPRPLFSNLLEPSPIPHKKQQMGIVVVVVNQS